MTIRYSVTYEFDTRAPLHHTGSVTATTVATAAARAMRAAQKAVKPVKWSSAVLVILERAE